MNSVPSLRSLQCAHGALGQRARRVSSLFFLCLLAVVACSSGQDDETERSEADADGDGDGDGGGEGGSSTSASPVSLDHYCETTATEYFDWLSACYGEDAYPETEREEFVDRTEARCKNAKLAVSEGRMSFDGERASACLSATEPDNCVRNYFDNEECQGIFEGRTEIGEPCYQEEGRIFTVGVDACASGHCVEEDQCPGVCEPCEEGECDPAPEGNGDIGEDCSEGACRSELRCDQETQVCVVPVMNQEDPCDELHVCSGVSVCIEGRCGNESFPDGPCALDHMCPEDFVCAGSEGFSSTCVPQPVAGDPCEVPLDCGREMGCVDGECTVWPGEGEECISERCATGLYCHIDDDVVEFLCVPLGEAGDSCRSAGEGHPFACALGLFCNQEEECAAMGELGDACEAGEDASCVEGSWCQGETDNATCAPRLLDGETCTAFGQCLSGDCQAPEDPSEPSICGSAQAECLPDVSRAESDVRKGAAPRKR